LDKAFFDNYEKTITIIETADGYMKAVGKGDFMILMVDDSDVTHELRLTGALHAPNCVQNLFSVYCLNKANFVLNFIYLNWRAIKQMISAGLLKRLIRGLKKKLLSIDEITCEGCLLGKATFRKLPKSSTSRPQAAAKTPFGMVSFDHCGPFAQQVNGMKYFSVALCHFSGATVVRLAASTCSKTSIDFVEEVHYCKRTEWTWSAHHQN